MEKLEGEGDGVRAGEERNLLALDKSQISFGEAVTDRDLVLSMLFSTIVHWFFFSLFLLPGPLQR